MGVTPAGWALSLGTGKGLGALFGGFNQASAYNKQAAYAVKSAEMDRKLAEFNVQLDKASTDEEIVEQRRMSDLANSDTLAAIGAANIELSGTPLEIAADQKLTLERGIQETRVAGARRQQQIMFAGETSAYNKRFQADLLKSQANASRMSGLFGFGTSLMGGLTNFERLGGEFWERT